MSQLLTAIEQSQNYTRTENSALTHASTLSAVLDFYYHAPARRDQDNTGLFLKAFGEHRLAAIRALFYVRDIRGGQGERETFRSCLRQLHLNFPAVFEQVLSYVPVYGRWDDVLEYVDNQTLVGIVGEQLRMDLMSDDGVSLLAKWMPSINTSSKETVGLAYRWAKALGWSPTQYRKSLSAIRGKIKLVETAMSQNQWGSISYGQIPSRAGMLYKDAFQRHDPTRYSEFLAAVMKGEATVNSGTIYPYELVQRSRGSLDPTAEAMWKCLPNYCDGEENALVVADVSGSMDVGVGAIKPIDVCLSLAIYIAERNRGIFHNKFITFSANPQVQELRGQTLFEKAHNLNRAQWDLNTDLQKVFHVVLHNAVKNRIPESEMPRKIFIISDMEFDRACSDRWEQDTTNFDAIRQQYQQAGYEMPTLIFWNVNSRNLQTPVEKNQQGVFLVSGCSPSIFEKAVKAEATTPMAMMLEVLNGPRYSPIVL